MTHRFFFPAAILALLVSIPVLADEKPAEDQPLSYFKDIRPIFQAHCQGCHQPAKRGGEYVMTAFESLLSKGESGEAAIVPGKPAESYLVSQITPSDGKAEMPKGKDPLTTAEIELIRRWISEGRVERNDESTRLDLYSKVAILIDGRATVGEGIVVDAPAHLDAAAAQLDAGSRIYICSSV